MLSVVGNVLKKTSVYRSGLIGVLPCMLGCATWFSGGLRHDAKPLNIQTLDLYNQRDAYPEQKPSWVGDWVFRRNRLSLIDENLKSIGADVYIFQNLMERIGSPTESDQVLLSTSALRGVTWQRVGIRDYDDTAEREYMALALDGALMVDDFSSRQRNVWVIGNEGGLVATVVQGQQEPFVVFSVRMPANIDDNLLWFKFLEDKISSFVKDGGFCPRRVVVAGYIPSDQGGQEFQDLLLSLELKDSSIGFCQVASECITSSSDNDLLMLQQPEQVNVQSVRILLHQDAIVYSSNRNFDRPSPSTDYEEALGLPRLWPSPFFGWNVNARLPLCRDELGEEPVQGSGDPGLESDVTPTLEPLEQGSEVHFREYPTLDDVPSDAENGGEWQGFDRELESPSSKR